MNSDHYSVRIKIELSIEYSPSNSGNKTPIGNLNLENTLPSLGPEANHESEFNDEQVVNDQGIRKGRIHDDQHLLRHPYWIKMTYFYNPNISDCNNSIVSVSFIF